MEVSENANAELDALAEEAAAPEAPPADPAEGPGTETAAPGAKLAVSIAPEKFAAIIAPAIFAGGNAALRMVRVGPPLEQDEAGAITAALVNLCNDYSLLDALSPRAAAWLALGVAVGAPIGRRVGFDLATIAAVRPAPSNENDAARAFADDIARSRAEAPLEAPHTAQFHADHIKADGGDN